MRRILVLLVLAIWLAELTSAQNPAVDPASQAPGVALLNEARGLANDFSAEERAWTLLELAQAYDAVDRSQVEPTSLDLLSLAEKKLSPGPYRAAMEKNALTTLALVNPLRAAGLYRIQELPNEDPKISEDRRAYGARILFAKLWDTRNLSALPQIESLANWLGETGQYPYAAMAPVIKNVCKRDASRAQELFQEAISAFTRDPGFATTNRQFVSFLLDTHACVAPPSMRYAVGQALNAIEEKARDRKISRKLQASSESGTVSFNSEGEYLVFRLIPLINSVDAEWSKSILEKYPNVRSVPEPPLDAAVITAGAISFDGAPDSAMQNALDENRMVHLSELAKTNPKSALQSAALISDPGLRDVAFAALLPEYSKANAATAAQWETDVEKRLDSMPDDSVKLRLLVALGCRTGSEGQKKQAREYASRALDFGAEAFNQDLRSNPGRMAYQLSGFDPLADLAVCYGGDPSDADWIVPRIEAVANDLLRTHLLITLAKGPAMAKPRRIQLDGPG